MARNGSESDENGEDENDDGKVLVGVRISRERRQEWKDFVDDSAEFSSMAGMMRAGVDRIMNESDDAEMKERLEILLDDVSHLHSELSQFRDENREMMQEVDSAEEIAEEVLFLQEEIGADVLGSVERGEEDER